MLLCVNVRSAEASHLPAPFIFTLKTWSSGPGQSLPALPWSFVSKITNSKHQITNKSQIPKYKLQAGLKQLFFCLGF